MNFRKGTSTVRNLILVLGLLLASLSQAAESSQSPNISRLDQSTTERILFLGNSYFYYNDTLHNHVSRMLASLDAELAEQIAYKSATIGGATLDH